ncbi:HAAAP family serine/threonine permease [Vibrio sp. CAIM 722]|uniref:HAAAP family serine/threonine permease n=1 Tax=Vibrio eleionomae TaxID=2653505 RepID=A0A7X4LP92_9VIBR|nr:HAAAP family serine/threonine permease [Vibrio eleionomae]
MKDTQELQKISISQQNRSWTKHDTHWLLSLFGTAVGAGILFLPINLGIGGFWPLIIMAVIAFPMTYFAHRGLARFVLSSKNEPTDFTDVVDEHFGTKAGRLISWLYFLSIFPILLIYGVGLTNTVDSFLVHQANMASPARWLLSGALVFTLIAIMLGGEKIILRVFAAMVYPLAATLLVLSLYLIPYWHAPMLSMPSLDTFGSTVWLAIPVVVFSFSHAAAISSFANVQRRHYRERASEKSEQILRNTSMLLIAFVLLFVFSCIFALTPAELAQAKAQNISVLTYLANVTDNPFIANLGPLVAFVAITSSFLGHFLGARESLNGLIIKHCHISARAADKLCIAILFVSIWACAIFNPSILGMMEAFSGPVIAMILFLMPMLAVYKVPAMSKYRRHLSTYFILLTGALAVSAILYTMLK